MPVKTINHWIIGSNLSSETGKNLFQFSADIRCENSHASLKSLKIIKSSPNSSDSLTYIVYRSKKMTLDIFGYKNVYNKRLNWAKLRWNLFYVFQLSSFPLEVSPSTVKCLLRLCSVVFLSFYALDDCRLNHNLMNLFMEKQNCFQVPAIEHQGQ